MAQGSVDNSDLPDNLGADLLLLSTLVSGDDEAFAATAADFGPEMIRPLARALSNPDPGIRRRAAAALASHGDKRAGIVLARFYHHFDPAVRRFAAERVTRENLSHLVPGLVRNAVSRFAHRKAEAPVSDLRDLIDMMQNGVYGDRRIAVRSLVSRHGFPALPVLAEALEESAKRPTMEYRPYLTEYEVLLAFMEFADPKAADALLLQLQDDRPAFRAVSLYLLAALHEKRAFDPALRLLEDGSFEVRRGAVAVLGRLEDTRAVSPLIGMLKDPDVRVVRATITMLAAFPSPEVVAALVPFLGAIGYTDYAVRTLQKVVFSDMDPVLAAAESGDPRMRAGAVEVLQSCDDPRCTGVLTRALADPDPKVVNAALPAFERAATPGSTDALVSLGERRIPGIDPRKLISALVATRDPRIAPVLAQHIHWMDLAESNMAKRAFESDRIEIRSIGDFAHALPALERNDDAVVQWMIRACKKLGPETQPLVRNAVKDKKLARGAARVLLGLGYKMKDAGDREILEALYGRSKKKEDIEKFRVLESLLPAGPAAPRIMDDAEVKSLVETFLDRENPASRDAGPELARIGLPAFVPLAEALESPKTDILDKQRICSVAAMFSDPAAVETLVGYLRDPHWGFRAAAAYALGGIRDAQALDALLPLLADRSVNVRLAAIAALGALDDERSVEALIPILTDKSMVIITKACQALGDLGYPAAIGPVIAVLSHPDASVRSAAAGALQQLCRQSREPLIREVENPDPRVRAGVITGLQICTDRRSRDTCIRALHDPEAAVREAAAGAFAKVWDPAAIEHLALLWDDPDVQVRAGVAAALANSRDPRGALALARLSRDRDETIARLARKACMQNLGTTETPDDAKRLIVVLSDPVFHIDEVVQRFVWTGSVIVPDLVAALHDPDHNLARGASMVLTAMGSTLGDPVVAEIAALLADPDEAVRELAVATLGAIGEPARAVLTGALESDDPLVWQGALEALGRVGEEKKTV